MLTDVEKVIFVLLALGAGFAALQTYDRISAILKRGRGSDQLTLSNFFQRAWEATQKSLTLSPTWKTRLGPSLMHAFVVWGFMFYLLVNLGDVLEGFFPGYQFPTNGLVPLLDVPYNFVGDILSVGVLVGMTALLIRRFIQRSPDFNFNPKTTLHPQVKSGGIRRDSAIVGLFIIFHIGSRFLGESFHLADHGFTPVQPFASLLGLAWAGLGENVLTVLEHVAFWGALGSILIFIPYFLRSKHIHIFMTPLNFLLKPERKSMGQLRGINFDDETITQYGAAKIEHLEWKALSDAYACIMCNRCQDACPAHLTGKALSPSALEINKRYFVNEHGATLAAGQETPLALTEFAISPEEVWACTACGACVEICPVGNEPMRDILDIRRNLVLMENSFPAQFQTAFKGMERQGNPWNVSSASRLEWAEGLAVQTVEQNPDFDILYWVGCAPATDPRARKTARALVEVMRAAKVNFAVLGKAESCTGDAARRSGNEALFMQLATQNVEVLNEVLPTEKEELVERAFYAVGGHLHEERANRPVKRTRRIVTTCPHCMHTLKNEYGDYGGHYEVIHHTQLINELVGQGRLNFDADKAMSLAYHDPCYLGRHNGEYEAPRAALQAAGGQIKEMARNRNQSFCCGAGGAQMWKEEEHGEKPVNATRFAEAAATGQKTLAVGCPFCLVMLSDAATAAKSEMQVRDVAEIVAESLRK